MTIKFNAIICSKRWQVDDHQSYGEVPGTAAYSMRTQDAVPDELEIIPEEKKDGDTSSSVNQKEASGLGGVHIPKTVVQQVDVPPSSQGEKPRPAAHSIHMADAVPDAVVRITDPETPLGQEAQSENQSNDVPIPETDVTKVDS